MHLICKLGLLATLACPGVLLADDSQRQITTEVDAALLHLAERNALDGTAPIVVSRPAQVRYELGAVIEVRAANPNGLKILAITPDSAATRMGLKAGDRLLAINGQRFDGTSPAANTIDNVLQRSGGKLRLLATRNGTRIDVTGNADVVGIPAYTLAIGDDASQDTRGCGFVSSSYLPPRSRGLFPAGITKLDGRNTPIDVNRLRAGAGRHVLTVQEQIPAYRFSMTQNRQRSLARQQPMAPVYQPLVVDIKPGVNYRVGVRLLKDKLDNKSIRANEYWEPVVWETKAEACQ